MDAATRAQLPPATLVGSFSVKLIALSLILLTIPLITYWQFEQAEQAQAKLLRNSAVQNGRVIAALLRPRFLQFKSESPRELSDALSAAAIGNSKVKVLVRPANSGPDGFIYVAAYPPLSADLLNNERQELLHSGVFERLAPTCDGGTDLAIRLDRTKGASEILTSITPVHVPGSCWIVITSQSAADLSAVPIDQSYWSTPIMRVAAAIYVLSTALVLALFFQMWRNVELFRKAARNIRLRGTGTTSFVELNKIPELGRVAADFDALVANLTASQDAIRKAAEDSAHALKAPLAVIAQSVEPLKRAIGTANAGAVRAVHLIESSVARLDTLVTSARDLEQAGADAMFPERRQMDLSSFLKRLVVGHEAALSLQGKRLNARIEDNISAYANEELIETVVENLVDNAASYTPKSEVIELVLEKDGTSALLTVGDHGPGVDPKLISQIFDRYVSNRPTQEMANADGVPLENHQGLGLWIVKRNVEGLGGKVVGRNREQGGFEVTVSLRSVA